MYKFLLLALFSFSQVLLAYECPLEFVRFLRNQQNDMTATVTISKLKIHWISMDDNEMDLKFEGGKQCKIPGGHFLVSAYYAKTKNIILLITAEGGSSSIKYATFYSAKTCKPLFKGEEVLGEWGVVDNRLESKAYCRSYENVYSCYPAQVYDLDQNCRPVKNEFDSLKMTKDILGQELRTHKIFKSEMDPSFIQMMDQYNKFRKIPYERY